ncbi:MAG: DNA sulfur modification protein DndB [bacterium]
MKKNREVLEKEIIRLLPFIAEDKSKFKEIRSYLKEKNITTGFTTRVLNNPEQVKNLNNLYLCIIVLAFNKVFQNLKPNEYFNENEIIEAKRFENVLKEEKQNKVIFENVFQIATYQYICPYMHCKEIIEYVNNALIRYNFDTQRGSKNVLFDGNIIKLPFINKEAINEIKDMILEGKFTSNMITFNMYRNGYERFDYGRDKKLIIEIGNQSYLDIVDGYHRLLGAMNALYEKPDLDFGFVINILNYTKDEAQLYIVQEDKRTPISKEIITAYNKQDSSVVFTEEVSKHGTEKTNTLYGKITNELEKDSLTSVQIFSKAIDYFFKIETPADNIKYQKYIVDFFNHIMVFYEKDFMDLEKSREKNYRLYPNSFIGYIALAYKLYNNNWQTKLEECLNNINLDKPNKELEKIGITHSRINKPLIKKISKYFLKGGGFDV